MPEFEPTAEPLRGEQGLPHAAEEADAVATPEVSAVVETSDVPVAGTTRDISEVAETQQNANDVETQDVAAVAEAREVMPVERALEELDRLAERDLADHPDAYQRIHADLRDALAAIDDA